MNGIEFLDWIKCLEEPTSTTESENSNITLQVDRILNINKAVSIDQKSQTNDDYTVASLELKVMDLEKSLINANNALKRQKSTNEDLRICLDQMQVDSNELEKTFAKITADVEVSRSAEKLALNKFKEAEIKIKHYISQNGSLVEKIKTLEEKIQQHHHAHSVIESMSISSRIPPNIHGDRKDPLSIIEYQWKADRERLNIDIEIYKSQAYNLEKELEKVKNEFVERLSKMYDPTEWALMTTKNAITAEENNRLKEEIRQMHTSISILKADISRLESDYINHKNIIKQQRIRINTLKEERVIKVKVSVITGTTIN